MLTYFLQVNVCWLLFYGVYYALLSKETFFTINRIWLIMSLLCGLAMPIIAPKLDIQVSQPIVEIMQPITYSAVQIQESMTFQLPQKEATIWSNWTILFGLYIAGIAFFLLKFVWGLWTIFKLHRSGKRQPKDGFYLIYTEGVKTPFSFFNWIFINQKTIENVDYQHIIEHEKAHVLQKHSFDILGIEILRGAFWLSPLVHFYAKSLRNVHEYLADAAVLQNTQKQSYGRLLISQTAAKRDLVIANHLNFSQLKKRIMMMSRNPSQRLALVKYALAAPIFLSLVWAFTLPNNPLMSHTEGVSQTVENNIEKVGNQLFKNKNKPKVTVRGTEEGWVLHQNLSKVTALEINEGYEIVRFKMAINKGDGYPKAAVYENKGSIFEKKILNIIQSSKTKDYYHFVAIWIRDLKTMDEYIYGDSYLNIVDNIPSYMVGVMRNDFSIKILKENGQVADSKGIDIKEVTSLERISFDLKHELLTPTKVSMSDAKIPTITGDTLPKSRIGLIPRFIDEKEYHPNPTVEVFKKHKFLSVIYEPNGDKSLTAEISSFILLRVPADKSDPYQVNVYSCGSDNTEMQRLILEAKQGDFYQFLNIIVKFSGEMNVYDIGSISYLLR